MRQFHDQDEAVLELYLTYKRAITTSYQFDVRCRQLDQPCARMIFDFCDFNSWIQFKGHTKETTGLENPSFPMAYCSYHKAHDYTSVPNICFVFIFILLHKYWKSTCHACLRDEMFGKGGWIQDFWDAALKPMLKGQLFQAHRYRLYFVTWRSLCRLLATEQPTGNTTEPESKNTIQRERLVWGGKDSR